MKEPLKPDDQFYRRTLPSQIVFDANLGRRRPSSAAFERRKDEAHASCYIDSLLEENDLEPSDVLSGHETFGLVAGTISCLRAYACDAAPDPDGVDPNRPHKCDPAHGKLLEPESLSQTGIGKNWRKLAKDGRIQVLADPGAEAS